MKYPLVTAALLACATPLGAHPHIFVDTGFEVIVDAEGRLTHLRITWAYDEFYSLLVTEDRGLDPDYDGVLTEAEVASLNGFDMRWIEGFNGDTVLLNGGEEIALSGPQEVATTFSEGRIITSHLRAVEGDAPDANGLVIKPYDPTYYTAYEVTQKVTVQGDDACRARVKMPEMNADLRELQQDLSALDANTDPNDVGLPEIGEALANEVVITCDAS
ncbi:MAG: DUF1007 family protein [Sulfitobacter sp.]|jgi:ABC-type uncharacterized transport system substrate-binding protein|uniref:DUF1007 family protein n=2 Tax=Sulfitobacter TaxID=60136 RepID=UPI0007C3E0E5|nr:MULTISPECIES: DUF1007 family protein [unclassified Sulfitobacter]KZX97703.1 polyphosphate kinase [Sulfitobacter sp. HI0027]KZX99856.1 polyphosphate kinase [Sulfitobacter sp. HI0021]KZZ02230.1 polyphosphate kinase [Sulfitobacter sp. HI0076]|tara:strand:+ start:49 stop:699 length:651 start_codon:yes stop_codon:yes gene_type:complete